MRGLFLVAIVASLSCAGCVTTGDRCSVTVANASDDAVTGVAVEWNGVVHYKVDSIGAHGAGSKVSAQDAIQAFTIRWKTQGGKDVVQAVKMEKPVPQNYRGRVYLEIRPDEQVRVFVMDATDRPSEIGWGKPADWEGSINVPGMSPQD